MGCHAKTQTAVRNAITSPTAHLLEADAHSLPDATRAARQRKGIDHAPCNECGIAEQPRQGGGHRSPTGPAAPAPPRAPKDRHRRELLASVRAGSRGAARCSNGVPRQLSPAGPLSISSRAASWSASASAPAGAACLVAGIYLESRAILSASRSGIRPRCCDARCTDSFDGCPGGTMKHRRFSRRRLINRFGIAELQLSAAAGGIVP